MDKTTIPEDQKIFLCRNLRIKWLSQYKVSQLVSDGHLIKLNKSYYEDQYQGEESDFIMLMLILLMVLYVY